MSTLPSHGWNINAMCVHKCEGQVRFGTSWHKLAHCWPTAGPLLNVAALPPPSRLLTTMRLQGIEADCVPSIQYGVLTVYGRSQQSPRTFTPRPQVTLKVPRAPPHPHQARSPPTPPTSLTDQLRMADRSTNTSRPPGKRTPRSAAWPRPSIGQAFPIHC